MTGLTSRQLFLIILSILYLGVGITVLVLLLSRQDANVRLAAVTGSLTLGGTLVGIVATMLTGGKSHPDASNLPPGSSVQSSQIETINGPSPSTTAESTNVTSPPTISSK